MAILLVDSYDSFTFNLKDLIQSSTGKQVYTIHNDTLKDFHDIDQYLSLFDAIVLGPGPGHPQNSKDVGILPYLINLAHPVPILGICLGFQCMAIETGNHVSTLTNIKHGQVYNMTNTVNDPLLGSLGSSFESVRYHSLHIDLVNDTILPLAFCSEDDGSKILMAGKHSQKPLWGVQYHPESICSKGGPQLIKNFMKLANIYNSKNRVLSNDKHLLESLVRKAICPDPLINQFTNSVRSSQLQITDLSIKDIFPADICDSLHQQNQDFIFLNSASTPGNWCIIGCPIPNESHKITHSTERSNIVKLSTWGTDSVREVVLEETESIWHYISRYMKENFIDRPKDNSLPFLGGFMGYFSYEEGQFIHLDTLERKTSEPIPDTDLVFIERAILYNISDQRYYVLSIKKDDSSWIDETIRSISIISKINKPAIPGSVKSLIANPDDLKIEIPNEDSYLKAFDQCQEYLVSGDSYELCYTTSATIKIPYTINPWEIYKILTIKNPSPYSSFMKFNDSILISSSPERFLSWQHNKSVQLRPIKGTVKKTPEMTLTKASQILNTPKEMGENLMIVDLIRHDLYSLLSKVEVSKLMSVEEYETVYQLVSVIEGQFSSDSSISGIDILSQSLPPGSMTGAPKKRSVEILQKIEKNERRGIYSGVCGYWSITDDADWSVVIRSVFSYENDLLNNDTHRVWRIGAGGAITILSDGLGEWEEMKVKLSSALQAFE